jgi:hypothetical protein
MTRLLIALLAALALAWTTLPPSSHAQELTETSDGFRTVRTQTFDVQAGGVLTMDRVIGSISVSTWDQNRVEVTETIRVADASRQDAQEYVQRYRSTMEQNGNSVAVRGPQNYRGRNAQHGFEVRVPQQYNVDVSTAGGAVNIEGPEGRVVGRTSGGAINVERVTGEVSVRTSGGALNLTDITGPADGNTSGGSINAERITGRLLVRTSGGSLNIADVQSNVQAETSGGSVRIENVQGAVRARTSGGDMDLRAVTSDVRAETSGGDIELVDIGGRAEARTSGGDIEGRNLQGEVTAMTSAGDIELDAVQAGVEARTSVGDIEVEMTLRDFSVDYATQLTTSHGDITITLPPDLPGSIDAMVEPLHQWDRDDILSDFPLSRTTPDDERSRTLRSSGDINGGGPAIELRTNGGSIRIERGSQ